MEKTKHNPIIFCLENTIDNLIIIYLVLGCFTTKNKNKKINNLALYFSEK